MASGTTGATVLRRCSCPLPEAICAFREGVLLNSGTGTEVVLLPRRRRKIYSYSMILLLLLLLLLLLPEAARTILLFHIISARPLNRLFFFFTRPRLADALRCRGY